MGRSSAWRDLHPLTNSTASSHGSPITAHASISTRISGRIGALQAAVEHVYIDDPISSLDEHNAIVVANHFVQLYREAHRPIRTVVSTHHALFFNVLHHELQRRDRLPHGPGMRHDRRHLHHDL